MNRNEDLSIVILGASGDLAARKVVPALFALYCQGLLPPGFRVFGFARTAMTDASFRSHLRARLTCRYTPPDSCEARMDSFLARCFYCAGSYDATASFLNLYETMRRAGEAPSANRVFYMAVPPSVLPDACRSVGNAGFARCGARDGWARVVVEKPFGHDRASSDALAVELARVFTENEIYRIDHYLGKEVVQNLQVLRFANTVFEPLWNRHYVKRVHITWKEDIGVEGRGASFDAHGIVRDVVQNHLTQILALLAMERPASLRPNDVRAAKVRVLRHVAPADLSDVVVGQYTEGVGHAARHAGYRQEPGVSPDSRTPTFAAFRLRVNTDRWQGVPFFVSAGKGLDSRVSEVRLIFREIAPNLFGNALPPEAGNDLFIRIQPDEAILLRIVSKVPGLHVTLRETHLDLRYAEAFRQEVPDAYERLLLDVVAGDKNLFVGVDELAAAWDIYTPLLRKLEERRVVPEPYPFGSAGPAAAARLLSRKERSNMTASGKPKCKGNHKGHLCVLVSEGKFDEIKELACKPRQICFNCGRVANSARNLCNPMPWKDDKAGRG